MPEPPGVRAAVFPAVGRLRFADDLEPSFTQHRLEQSLPFARFALILALLLYALSGILDFYIVPVGARWIWVIRYVIFCPVAIAVFGLTFTRWFRPVMQPVLAGVATLAGLGIVAMIAIAQPAAGHHGVGGDPGECGRGRRMKGHWFRLPPGLETAGRLAGRPRRTACGAALMRLG
jgi:hypothetical protein